jgi:hypothetical protein
MFAAIRRYNAFPNAAATIASRVNEEFLPKLRQMPGFVGYYVVDGGDGTLISVSLFEDRAAADGSTQAATAWVHERLHHLIRSAPVISTGEVVVVAEPAGAR